MIPPGRRAMGPLSELKIRRRSQAGCLAIQQQRVTAGEAIRINSAESDLATLFTKDAILVRITGVMCGEYHSVFRMVRHLVPRCAVREVTSKGEDAFLEHDKTWPAL
ncbi:hypothetical protein Bbelb_436070 [Branchiostoma belcheri]|nr:hypothetical protein Bbelb_436070 [Branchiostoma belcheri]